MILKNGKRIDGCADTLPIGTVQPFLGLTPPKGYLLCQGQAVSKTVYSELYAICGDLFGQSTDTEFFLPDLRGKTIAGYNENDGAMNTIGKLLGSGTHIHTTSNHTLTESEMPLHTHSLPSSDQYGKNFTPSNEYIIDSRSIMRIGQANLVPMGVSLTESAGSSQPHNHGNTGEASNYQPTIVLNWIVKAAMLIPEYFIVENTLTSTSTGNALSAAQGKILNDTKLSLSGGKMTGLLWAPWVNLINSANEFNFTGSGFAKDSIWFNYRGSVDGYTAEPIKAYSFGNGQGSTSGVKLSADYFDGLATKATADANGNIITKTYVPNSIPVCVGSQILYNGLSGVGPKDKTALIGSYDRMLVEDLMRKITVPSGYHAEYRLTAQGTSGGATYVHIYLNNLDLLTVGTWSGSTFRTIRSSEFFKSTDITLEPTYQYAQNGINLYYSVEGTSSNESWEVWNITLHAYIVKD